MMFMPKISVCKLLAANICCLWIKQQLVYILTEIYGKTNKHINHDLGVYFLFLSGIPEKSVGRDLPGFGASTRIKEREN